MKTEDALNFITQALNQATLKGTFTLQDASNVALAISTVAKYIETQNAINIQRENLKSAEKMDMGPVNNTPTYDLNKSIKNK